MPSASRIAHSGMPFANPMSEAAVNAAIAALPLPSYPVVLDTGCGNGEILLRTLQAHAPASGIGVDLDADAVAEANERAVGLPARFELRDAATIDGWFDAAINVGASHAHGGFPAALKALKSLAPVAMYGEGFWQKPPSPEFLAALGGATVDELSDLDGLRAEIRDAGFHIAHESLATEHDWACYEEALAASAEDPRHTRHRRLRPPDSPPTRAAWRYRHPRLRALGSARLNRAGRRSV